VFEYLHAYGSVRRQGLAELRVAYKDEVNVAIAEPPRSGRLDADRLKRPDLRALLAVLSAASQTSSHGDADLRRVNSPLRISEFDVLVAIGVNGPLRPSEISRQASLAPTPTTVSTILGRLEKRGLVTRMPHPTIGGGVMVTATPEGLEMLEVLFPEVERKVISWFGGHFTDTELTMLAEMLERI
jgi:DNA-binding MarR family transcriptional regulator